jgi:type IV secretory pathway TrbF-like protein
LVLSRCSPSGVRHETKVFLVLFFKKELLYFPPPAPADAKFLGSWELVMTIDELLAREAIRKTIAKYNISGDRLKVDDYVSCFTEDGVMEASSARGAIDFRYTGRDEIRAWQLRWRDRKPEQGSVHKATFVRHHLSTSAVDVKDLDTASARTYWVAWTDIGPDHCGYYLDTFRKVGEEWLIAHRHARMDWASPNSLFGTAVENST